LPLPCDRDQNVVVSEFAEIVDALSRSEAYPHRPDSVQVVHTHISAVFLAGDRAYKVKRPVKLPFLDFTELAARKHFCDEEVRLNQPLGGRIYVGVVPIRRRDGGIVVDGPGDLVDWAVEMVRLPEHRLLDAMLVRGDIDNDLLRRIAELLADFHAHAATGPAVDQHGTHAAVRELVEANFEESERFTAPEASRAVTRPLLDFLEAEAMDFLREEEATFHDRVARGRIRDGHGDLHAGNICVLDEEHGGLVVYDRIEFSAKYRCADVAADLAFLLMDLDHRGYRAFSEYLLREYVTRTEDEQIVELIDFYKGYRACVRAKVAAFTAASAEDAHAAAEARASAMSYFNLAAGYALPPSLVLTCGLPGAGKSWAAERLVSSLDGVVLNSDATRKRLFGVPLTERRREPLHAGIYDAEHTAATYGALAQAAREQLARGRSVIVDAGFRQRAQRAPFLALARELAVPTAVLWVDPGPAALRERLAKRAADARSVSDADAEVSAAAGRSFEPPKPEEGAVVIKWSDGASDEEQCMSVLERLLRRAHPGD
jgi:aminoglycoside phosphotransferase family enzyme/predicted kinase